MTLHEALYFSSASPVSGVSLGKTRLKVKKIIKIISKPAPRTIPI